MRNRSTGSRQDRSLERPAGAARGRPDRPAGQNRRDQPQRPAWQDGRDQPQRSAPDGRDQPPRPAWQERREAKRAAAPPVEPLPDDVRLIVGLQPVREALRAHGSNARRLYALQDNPRCDRLAEFAAGFSIEVRRVGAGELDRLTRNARHQGVALLAPTLTLADWEQVVTRPDLLAVALDKISDPQNFGAIVRSAVALGGAAVLWGEHASAPLTPATFRASAGAVEHATLCRVGSLVTALDRADAMAVQIVGLDAQADRPLSAVDLRLPTLIALGAEDRGLSRAVRQRCTVVAKLPMTRTLDSLNVSAAAAIALYEAVQQRTSRDR